MVSGHIHLLRKIWNNPVLDEGRRKFSKLEAWLWILTREARGVDDPKAKLKRGEFRVSRRQMAVIWGWSRSAVDRFFKDLQAGDDPMIKAVENLGQFAGQLTGQFIVCKYETYNKVWDSRRDSSRDILNKDIKKDEKKDSPCPTKSDASGRDLFEIFREENKVLPKVEIFSGDRADKARTRIRRATGDGRLDQYLADFRKGVRKAQTVPFLRGEGDRGWKASFDWFIANDKNLYKVIEGNYDGLVRRAGPTKDLVGSGNGGDPARTPEDWTAEQWEVFEKINGAEAAKRLRAEYGKGGS